MAKRETRVSYITFQETIARIVTNLNNTDNLELKKRIQDVIKHIDNIRICRGYAISSDIVRLDTLDLVLLVVVIP